MEIKDNVLAYLLSQGKKDKYKLARALKIDVEEVAKVFDQLQQEGAIEIKEGKAMIVEGKKPTEEVKEEQSNEEFEEEKPIEEEIEERVEGTVKFFNPNKGFGFIKGDDGKEYYVHKSGLKEGVTIEADNRVSFKVVQSNKGTKAEDVENIS